MTVATAVPSPAILLTDTVFTNRELATLIWLGLFIAWAISRDSVRSAAVDLLKQVIFSKLTPFFLLVVGYVCLVVWLLASVDAWTWSQLFETAFWFFGPGLVLLFRMNESKYEHPFRRYVLEAIGISVLIEFIVGLHSFALWAELLLVPIATLVAMTLAYAATKSEYKAAESFLNGVMAIGGFALLVNAVVTTTRQPDGAFTWDNLRDFSVPLLLTFAFLPLAYLLAVGMSYETLLVRVRFKLSGDDPRYRYTRRRTFRTAGLRLSTIKKLDHLLARNTYRDCTEADIDRAFEQLEDEKDRP